MLPKSVLEELDREAKKASARHYVKLPGIQGDGSGKFVGWIPAISVRLPTSEGASTGISGSTRHRPAGGTPEFIVSSYLGSSTVQITHASDKGTVFREARIVFLDKNRDVYYRIVLTTVQVSSFNFKAEPEGHRIFEFSLTNEKVEWLYDTGDTDKKSTKSKWK